MPQEVRGFFGVRVSAVFALEPGILVEVIALRRMHTSLSAMRLRAVSGFGRCRTVAVNLSVCRAGI